jgi:hypothetical protein
MTSPEVKAAPLAQLDSAARQFYRDALRELNTAGLKYLVGGAYAFSRYTGISRHTKDFDIFIREADYPQFETVLRAAGLRTDLTFPHWLGKAFRGDEFIDIIFSGGNGEARVDDEWFDHAVDAVVLGMEVRLCPPEEMIWSKSFVMERERYDGADVAHLLKAMASRIDWERLLRRFDQHWRVLFSHLILFGYIYPVDRDAIPAAVLERLMQRVRREIALGPAAEQVCQGTLLSRSQYLSDLESGGYSDARLVPLGRMNEEEIDHWTAAIDEKDGG